MPYGRIVLVVGVAAIATLAAFPIATADIAPSGGAAVATYHPIQGFSRALGSKRTVGYFTSAEGRCHLTMMIAEAIDPETAVPTSATRVRLALLAGQKAYFDSDERATIEIACGPDAATLLVEASAAVD